MIPTDSSDHLIPPLRFRSREFVRHFFIAAIGGVLPIFLIFLGSGIRALNAAHGAHPGLASIAQGIINAGFYVAPFTLALLVILLVRVSDLHALDRRERWVLRLAVLFFLITPFIATLILIASIFILNNH